jgi:hypothetical protein
LVEDVQIACIAAHDRRVLDVVTLLKGILQEKGIHTIPVATGLFEAAAIACIPLFTALKTLSHGSTARSFS